MAERSAKLARSGRPLVGLAAAAFLLAGGANATAQDGADSPLRFLRPWLERQLAVPGGPSGEGAPRGEQPAPAAPDAAAPEGGGAAPEDVAWPEMPAGTGEQALPPPAEAAAPTPSAEDPLAPEPEETEVGGASPEGPVPMPPPAAPLTPPAESAAAPTDAQDAIPPAMPDAAPESVAAPAAPKPGAAPAAAGEQGPQPLRLGVLAGRDVMATMAAIEPVAKSLSDALRRQVEILPLSSYGAMIDAQAQRRIDGGFYSAAAFAVAEAHCGCLEPLVAPAAADGGLAYFATIVARAHSGIVVVADLQGRTVAMGPDDSVGTRRMQLAGLLAEGVDPGQFGAIIEVESAEDAVRLVLSGAADAAFAWSSMAGELQTGYSRGTLSDLVARGELDMSEVAVIWRSPAITHGPFAVLKTLEEDAKRRLEDVLLELERWEPAAYDIFNPYYSGGYETVEPDDYAGVEVLTAHNVDAVRLPAPPRAIPAPAEISAPAPAE